MDINIVTRFNQDVANFETTFGEFNEAKAEMDRILAAYKVRRDEDKKETEYQRDNLMHIMGSDYFSSDERVEAKRKLAQLEFHVFLPTAEEQELYRKARERALQAVNKLSYCREALTESRSELHKAFEMDVVRTLKNDMSTYVHTTRQLDRLPLNL